jgi:RimJ/RimL family protein N-acetyltransferase
VGPGWAGCGGLDGRSTSSSLLDQRNVASPLVEQLDERQRGGVSKPPQADDDGGAGAAPRSRLSGVQSVRHLRAGDVVLREFTEADVPDLALSFADPVNMQWSPGPTDPDDLRVLVAERNDWSADAHRSWAVEHDGRFAGSVSLHHLDLAQQSSELGYWVSPWARRRGVARRAVGLASTHGFTTLGLVRVFCFHAVENVASCGVATSAGFLQEGTLRQSYRYADGQHHDEHLHARLATDPPV